MSEQQQADAGRRGTTDVRPDAARAVPSAASAIGASPLQQSPLPFADTALEPAISAQTLAFHHGKHHRGYFDTLNKLVEGTPLAEQTLEQIILDSHDDPAAVEIFNNAAQAWNHNFYWSSLSPEAQSPAAGLADAINRDFGSLKACKAALAKASINQFGTGWGWLVVDGGTLKAISTQDAGVPFTHGQRPLLTVDVWEHAYYLDWQNRRADHVAAILDGHLNWRFAERNHQAALGA